MMPPRFAMPQLPQAGDAEPVAGQQLIAMATVSDSGGEMGRTKLAAREIAKAAAA
jgi:hypothetical protein